MDKNSSDQESDRSSDSGQPEQAMTSDEASIAELCERYGCDSANVLRSESFALSELSSQFIFWIPKALPAGVSVSVSSSRLGQKLDQQESWFDAIRTIAVQTQSDDNFLISAKGTTTDPFVCRIAELFGIPLVEFKPFPKKANASWFKQIANLEEELSKQNEISRSPRRTVWYQQLESAQTKAQLSEPSKCSPQTPSKQLNANDLLISIASTAVLLSVRKSGNIFAAANRRLVTQTSLVGALTGATEEAAERPIEDLTNDHSSIKLLINRKLTSRPVESDLLDKGARGWWLYHQNSVPQHSRENSNSNSNSSPFEPVILELDEVKSDQFLLHWTRRRVGPWPDQTHADYLDDLIFRSSGREHSGMSALCRILASRTILGSNHLTRDQRNVVCFSDLPIQQLKERRVFRPHLSRWDFEPYGLAIDRRLLAKLGAKPVIYGDDSTWESLSQSDQPFFQPQTSASGKIDWKSEREFRIVGDVRLDLIPRDQAFIFVANEAEAKIIASLCHWPVVVVGDPFRK